MKKLSLTVILGVTISAAMLLDALYISNLDSSCMRCLCEGASGCNMTLYCLKQYCGPFHIAKIYWADAGHHVLDDDVAERVGAYQDCANDYNCASRIVYNYMSIYGKDCNSDGVTNCDDYMMVHLNGGNNCYPSLEGKRSFARYVKCRKEGREKEYEE